MAKKTALITGITGQDGSYLAELLLSKNYKVHGLVRRVASENEAHRLWRLKDILKTINLHAASLESYASIVKLVEKLKPTEIYHLGAQSYIDYAFKDEFSTINTNINGTHYLLSAIKEFSPKTKMYFAASSEMFGKALEMPQNEKTPFYPRSTYGISKVAGFDLTRNYREAYNIFCCSGILFNHESPRRGFEFVTRKITHAVAKIKLGLQKDLTLGNVNAMRDWGHAKDYVEMCWKILQHKKADDFVIATEKQYSVKFFIERCLKFLNIKVKWRGKGLNETARIIEFNKEIYPNLNINQIIIKISKKYFRPNEVENLIGNTSKAKKTFKWKPKIKIDELIKEMLESDLKIL